MTLKIAWLPQYSHQANGYGFVAKRMRRALFDAGAHLTPPESDDWDYRVHVGVPSHAMLGRVAYSPDTLIHTMFEATPIPPYWPRILNRYAAVWVPSQWCADLFKSCGVTTKIVKSGYGVDPRLFQPNRRDFANLNRPLRFGIWAHSFGDRKHAWRAVQAYIDAAPTDSELQIKITNRYEAKRVKVDEKVRKDITVHLGAWNTTRLADWVATVDVMLYLSAGEGFGLQPLEAMSTGAVMIVADNTGMQEYIEPDNRIPIPCTGKRPITTYKAFFRGDTEYLVDVPDFDFATSKIRWCASNRGDLNNLSSAAIQTANRMTWDIAGQNALAMLSEME